MKQYLISWITIGLALWAVFYFWDWALILLAVVAIFTVFGFIFWMVEAQGWV